jgi:chromosomal replication initiator protein
MQTNTNNSENFTLNGEDAKASDSKRELWITILSNVENSISRANFITWFQNTGIIEIKNETLHISVPSTFARDWLSSKYESLILQFAKQALPQITKLEFEIENTKSDEDNLDKIDIKKVFKENLKINRKLPNKAEVSVLPGVTSKILQHKHTLQNFIHGEENRIAHAVCCAVAQNPGTLYNPLFIYGGVGLGKTHLLQATGHQITLNDPDKVIVYMTSEKFMNEIIAAIGNKRTRSFKDKYRNVDCFIIDDIQFLENKIATQEEFFHTFNELYDNGKQIIISSDKNPKQLKGIEERLTSRFQMGMVVEVNKPSFETRRQILENKCLQQHLILPKEIIEFIAYNLENNIRELEGALMQTLAITSIENETPTVRRLEEIIQRFSAVRKSSGIKSSEKTPKSNISSKELIDLVARHFHIEKSELSGEKRAKEFSVPRQICMYLLRKEFAESFENIGSQLGGRSHTTVMHAFSKISDQLKKDRRLLSDIHSIKEAMGL